MLKILIPLSWNVVVFCILIYTVFFELSENVLAKRLRENIFLYLMQLHRRLFSFVVLGVALWCFIQFPLLVQRMLIAQAGSVSDVFKSIFSLYMIFIAVFYRKCWWHNLVSDNKTIYFEWYVSKHLRLNKKRQFDKAFEYLEKASQLKPGSIFVWCIMASFVEYFYKDSGRADRYLARAREIIDTNPGSTDFDRSVYEDYMGIIARNRDAVYKSLSHFKRAYELDPRPYRKVKYEEAVKFAEAKKDAL